jgi:hypothetical protein
MIDIDRMRDIAEAMYSRMVEATHGERGTRALRAVLEFLQGFYGHVAPETRRTRIVVLKQLDDVALGALNDAIQCASLSHMPVLSDSEVVVQILRSGQFLVSQTAVINPLEAAEDCVVYTYENRTETFYAGGDSRPVINPFEGYASIFAIPTFDDLKLALSEYRDKQARRTSCRILAEVWKSEKRIILRAGPEPTMRNSLTQFLKACLRGDVEVRPEQNVDESHPVDIKVTWFMTNRLALIEIKWLGASGNGAGALVRYSDSRARDGAKQLADYLDWNAVQAPQQVTRGYLVVLDGRRARVRPWTTRINHADGFRYEGAEIVFEPRYHEIRSDFEVPIRMFMEPICD